MTKITIYQMSSRKVHMIEVTDPILETKEEAITRRTKDWPEYDSNPSNCTGHGHAECMRQGKHSWFNHSQDSYYN